MSDLKQIAKDTTSRCPHCGNVTGLELSADLRYRCRICGGPRVPTRGAKLERSLRETEHLVRARRAHKSAWLFRALWIVSGVVGGFTFLATLLTLFLFSGLGTAWASLLVFGAVPLATAFWARHRTRRAKGTVQDELELAWASVAHELLNASESELTSGQVAELMLTDEAHADMLLGRLNVDDQVRSHVTDDGQITYSVRSHERFRVAPADVGGLDTALFDDDDAEQHREALRRRSD